MSKCYVISVHHTLREHRYITIWRPEDKGYCWAVSRAGVYPLEQIMQHQGYYNDGDRNVTVPCEVLDQIAVPPIPGHNDNDAGPCVENNRSNWEQILASLVAVPKFKPLPVFKGSRRKQLA